MPGFPYQVAHLRQHLAVFLDMEMRIRIALPQHDFLFVSEMLRSENQQFVHGVPCAFHLFAVAQRVVDAIDELDHASMLDVDGIDADAMAMIVPDQMIS